MTDREREALDGRLAEIVAMVFPAAIVLGDGPMRWVYEALHTLRTDIAATEQHGTSTIERRREAK